MYCKGALYLIDSLDCASEPLAAFDVVVIVTFEKPPISPDNSNALAPLASVLFVTIYSKIIILPSIGFLPKMPSPKYISYLSFSLSCRK